MTPKTAPKKRKAKSKPVVSTEYTLSEAALEYKKAKHRVHGKCLNCGASGKEHDIGYWFTTKACAALELESFDESRYY